VVVIWQRYSAKNPEQNRNHPELDSSEEFTAKLAEVAMGNGYTVIIAGDRSPSKIAKKRE
jgi:hypothetical protein